jgi:hypothetical protein
MSISGSLHKCIDNGWYTNYHTNDDDGAAVPPREDTVGKHPDFNYSFSIRLSAAERDDLMAMREALRVRDGNRFVSGADVVRRALALLARELGLRVDAISTSGEEAA